MRMVKLFRLSLVAIAWPHTQALACETTHEEETRQRVQLERDRRDADVVAVGTWVIDASCREGQECMANFTISEVKRGNPSPRLRVRYSNPESICDFDAPLRNTPSLFYLNRDEDAKTYSFVHYEPIETSNW